MENDNDQKPFLNGKQYAKKLGISVRTLRYQVAAGRCDVQPIPGTKPPKWRASDVDAFVAGGAAQ